MVKNNNFSTRLENRKPSNEKSIQIEKEHFEVYEKVRKSGVTNMYHLLNVVRLTGLTRTQIIEIMKDYTKYSKDFNGN